MQIGGFPSGSAGEESACNVGDVSSIPGLGRSPGGGHGNPLQDSRLENPMDGGAWWAAVHKVAESDTSEATEHISMHANQAVASNSSPVLKGISKKEQTFLGGIHISNYK